MKAHKHLSRDDQSSCLLAQRQASPVVMERERSGHPVHAIVRPPHIKEKHFA